MRVLLVADIVGGVRTFTRELVREVDRRGAEVHLALIGAGSPDEFPGAASCEVRDLRLEWMPEAWEDVERTSAWVEELRDRYRPEVVHMNTFAPLHDPEVPMLLTAHSCVLTWWRAVHGCEAPASWNRYRDLVRRALARADAVVVPTRALGRELGLVYGDGFRTRVIANGRAVDARDGAAKREPLVVSVGRLWDKAKNSGLLIEASSSIEGRVVLIGPKRDDAAVHLPMLAERDVLAWLSRAAVFAEPARYEPFGLAALEAALCGCALVLGDIPTLREVWGDAALFVSPDDPEALIHAVNGLLRDPLRSSRTAARARERALRCPPTAMAERYLSAYEQVVQTRVAA
jgi:glycogen(starch) synthase